MNLSKVSGGAGTNPMNSGTPLVIPCRGIGSTFRMWTPGALLCAPPPEYRLTVATPVSFRMPCLALTQTRRLRDPEDHELRWSNDGHADLGHHHPEVTNF